jgi:hypothetical protein
MTTHNPYRVKDFKSSTADLFPGDAFWRVFSARLCSAWLAREDTAIRGGEARQGAERPKRPKEREIDQARFDALADVASDHPYHPLGLTQFAVAMILKDLWVSWTRGDVASAAALSSVVTS